MNEESRTSLLGSLPVDKMEGPYSARLPSSSIGEKSRRAPVGRETAEERVLNHFLPNRLLSCSGRPPDRLVAAQTGRQSAFLGPCGEWGAYE